MLSRPLFVMLVVFALGAAAATFLFRPEAEPAPSTTTLPQDPAAVPTERPVGSVPVAVAPPPRDPYDTRCFRGYYEEWALPAGDTSDTKGWFVDWRVRVRIRRLVSTGKDAIDFHWGVKYTGPRAPFIMHRPSLADPYHATQAEFYAFAPGEQKGRWLTLPEPEKQAKGAPLWERPPTEWFLWAAREEWESGRDTILMDDIKEALQTQFPGEFTAEHPPKLYTRFRHRARLIEMDAWTGELESKYLEVPHLNTW